MAARANVVATPRATASASPRQMDAIVPGIIVAGEIFPGT